ncbi:hypothetical protein BGX24_002306 [Mortierella sp. AD032]|nr:hypothetical protein BGX24_002306 [Mortierella sp. AD032]
MSSHSQKPCVLIVGAGLGGLMLAALLEKSKVPYFIFERTSVVTPLGSALSIGPNVLPVFEQLGIYDEFLNISKPIPQLSYFKEHLKACKPSDQRPVEKLAGYGYRIVSRPMLYELLLSLVPEENILYGRRVLNITEDDDKVVVHINKHESYEGDIVVGADGPNSAVRQRMYQQLKTKGELPKTDSEELPFSYSCLVGQTGILNPQEFPIIKEPVCHFNVILGHNKPFTWVTFNTAQQTVCWMLINQLSRKSIKEATEQRFRASENSGWGTYPPQSLCDETRDFPVQLNDGTHRTLGTLYDLTPKDLISMVVLEEKVFDTWYSGRTVLLGDACHKIHPGGGQGVVTALHDAIALANLLYALPASTNEEVTKVFEEYRDERHPIVTQTFKSAQLIRKMTDKGIDGAMTLFLATNMPAWLWRIVLSSTLKARPQVGFLPEIKNKGTVAPIPSSSFLKAKAVYDFESTLHTAAAV